MKNLTVRTRLTLGFLAIAFFSLLIGAYGYSSLRTTEGYIENIGDTALPYAINLGTIRAELMNIRAIQRTFLIPGLDDGLKKRGLESLEKAREKYREAFRNIDKLRLSDEETAKFTDLKRATAEWRELNDVFFKSVADNDYATASDIALYSGREKQFRAAEAIDRILDNQKTESVNLVAATKEKVTSVTVYLAGLVLAVFVFSLFLGYFLTRSIAKPLSVCVAFACKISSGIFGESLKLNRNDEIGQLSASLNDMVTALVAKIEDANVKSRIALEESEKARTATAQAVEATQRAEQAKASGMLEAACQLEGVVEVASSASEELSAQIEQSSKGSQEQTHRVGETATAMVEMNATVLEVAKSASRAAETADTAKLKAQDGFAVVA